MDNSDCYYDSILQNQLDAPMRWIGMYIAAASAVCTFAMAVDAFKGFKGKKLWLPCKYFSLNAASLTVLAVAMKLTVDFTTSMGGVSDQIAIISSLVMMSTALGNFATSLASMDNNDILLNLTALAILVITIAANVCIHDAQIRVFFNGRIIMPDKIAAIVIMFVSLIILCSFAVVVPTTKRYIEFKYQEVCQIAVNERVEAGESFSIDELRILLKKHWVMAVTGSPQFVMARSVLCVVSGVMCLFGGLALIEAYIRLQVIYGHLSTLSSYKWSTNWILVIQSAGVAVGTIAPLSRWFMAVRFHSSMTGSRSFKNQLNIEPYWIQRLVEWRERSMHIPIGHRMWRKFLHDAKRLFLNICIRIQILIVLFGKLAISSTACMAKCFLFLNPIKKLKGRIFRQSNEMTVSESRDGIKLDYSPYVLQLEGEQELPSKTLAMFCNEVDKMIEIGKKRQPKNIIGLLQKSENFNGVIEFDSKQVKSLHSQEPPNCWSLAIVTLTSIAVALPHITNEKVQQLLTEVGEGLSLVRLVEETMDNNNNKEGMSIRNAADVVWVGLELYNKWQDKDIQGRNVEGGTDKNNMVQNLSDTAERTVVDFMSGATDSVMKNPRNWPVRVTAANSMYRACQTILLSGVSQGNEEMFDRLCIVISSIVAACFTNLPRVITIMCRGKVMEEKTESVSRAAVLLGESVQVIDIVHNRELPCLDPDKAGYIEEWRAIMEQSY